jgi:NADH-quinone oxidoreductase subunit J
MSVSAFFFYLFSSLILVFGILTVTAKALFRSAIYLLFTLTNVAALYFMLHYEFIAAVQIIVYVGGIVVLILFSLFLTQQAGVHLSRPSIRQIVFSALSSLSGFALVWTVLSHHQFQATSTTVSEYNVAQVGRQLLSLGRDGYILPFEAISILLLAAMVGCIAIAYKQPDPVSANGKAKELGNIIKVEKELAEIK